MQPGQAIEQGAFLDRLGRGMRLQGHRRLGNGLEAAFDGRVRRVGMALGNDEADPESQARFQTFGQRLADLGWVEGRNLRIDVRW